ncbi:hypothetical protein SH668x_000831 [Planctomicrobium sp. SH668]|uniref:hypothetical protein n=1 Tax=Planctomicrobium sp. SH668 TaxID=3448126 RepID=UPI003F5B976A
MAGQTYSNSSIEKSFGGLFLGVLLVGTFFLLVLGMQQFQDNAKSAADEPVREKVEEPVLDFAH